MEKRPLPKPPKKRSYFELWMLFPVLGLACFVGLAAFFALYKNYWIPSASMEPTLLRGDRLFIHMWRFETPNPRRGDLVVFESPERPGVQIINRVIGLPGDRIEIVDKRLRLNGRPIVEPYAVHSDDDGRLAGSPALRRRDQFGPFVVPAEHFFMMGDNRDNSYDSRFYGPVPRRLLRGGGLVWVYWSPRRERIGQR